MNNETSQFTKTIQLYHIMMILACGGGRHPMLAVGELKKSADSRYFGRLERHLQDLEDWNWILVHPRNGLIELLRPTENINLVKRSPTKQFLCEDKRRYYIKGVDNNTSFHVMERGRKNEFGDDWCEFAYLTWNDAVTICEELNSLKSEAQS